MTYLRRTEQNCESEYHRIRKLIILTFTLSEEPGYLTWFNLHRT